MLARVGAAICTKLNRPIHSRLEFEQALDGAEALEDALGVVEAIDADADAGGPAPRPWRWRTRAAALARPVSRSSSGAGGQSIEIG